MRVYQVIFIFILLFGASGCIEIIDDLSLNSDGSGTFKYNLNLSASKVKINSILALDSLDGKRVPKIEEIQQKVQEIISSMSEQDGISNVTLSEDYDEYLFKFQCEFESVEKLQIAIKEVVKSQVRENDLEEFDHNWISYDGKKMSRSVPQITIKKSKEINQNDINLLREGTYTSITRFETEIDHFENQNARVSKSNKAVMVRTDPYSLTQDHHLLDNIIYLVKTE